jgi:hypothetical protein
MFPEIRTLPRGVLARPATPLMVAAFSIPPLGLARPSVALWRLGAWTGRRRRDRPVRHPFDGVEGGPSVRHRGLRRRIVAFAAPMIAQQTPPQAIYDRYPAFSISSLHRLIIWKFVAEKIAAKPLAGWGLDAAPLAAFAAALTVSMVSYGAWQSWWLVAIFGAASVARGNDLPVEFRPTLCGRLQ